MFTKHAFGLKGFHAAETARNFRRSLRDRERRKFAALVILFLGILSAMQSAYAQGAIRFANIGGVNAPVTYPDGSPVGPEFFAQVYAGPKGTPTGSLRPQFPVSRFRDQPPESRGYFFPQVVTLEDLRVNDLITVVVRAYNGSSWEDATWRGESDSVDMQVLGDSPASIIGLKPFSVYAVPEPGVFVLLVIGLAGLCMRRGA